MKKNKRSKKNFKTELIRNLARITVILFFSSIISTIFCKVQLARNKKILESTVQDSFVFQSMLLANSIDSANSDSFIDIENLDEEDDKESFVSDAAIKTGTTPYYIRVNYGANVVTILKKDEKKNYTVPYKAMLCSSGKATPKSGTYKITYKYRWLKLYGDVYGQYSTRIVKSILFHSVPYLEQRADTLEYEEYDKLGTTASAGCIRLSVSDAKWIYDNIASGTYVEFYSDTSNPGPLGKPKLQKISNNKENRNWDPTDPDINNPWNGGSGIPSVIPKKVISTPEVQETTPTPVTTTPSTPESEKTTTEITNTNQEQTTTKKDEISTNTTVSDHQDDNKATSTEQDNENTTNSDISTDSTNSSEPTEPDTSSTNDSEKPNDTNSSPDSETDNNTTNNSQNNSQDSSNTEISTDTSQPINSELTSSNTDSDESSLTT